MNLQKMKWILMRALKNCYRYILLYIGILVLCSLLSVSVNVINKRIVNELANSILHGEVTSVFVSLAVIYVIFYFLNSAAGFLTVFGVNSFRLNVDLVFHKIFMWKANQFSQECFLDDQFMKKYFFINKNITKVSSYIGNILNLLFFNLATIVSAVIFFAVYEPLLLIYLVLITGISILIQKKYSMKQYELEASQVKEQRYCEYFKSVLSGKRDAKELRVLKFRDFIYQKWITSFAKLRKEKLNLELKKINDQNRSSVVKLCLRCLSIILLVYSAFQSKYDIGTFVMLLGLVETCSGHINAAVSSVVSGAYADSKYLADYYDFIMPITNEELAHIIENKVDSGELVWGPFETLELKNVSFRYPNRTEEALDDVSIKVYKGEIVCILGYNGSGKTTLSKVIDGSLQPESGSVLLNGNEVNGKTNFIAFRYFGVAPQEFAKYSIKAQEVVGLGRIELFEDAEALRSVHKKANLDELAAKYPNGLQTILGKEYDDMGIDLSGGEWQWLTIASAYMGEPEILLLDEPTASIDPIKELDMVKNFRTVLGDKTAIIISHRMCFARIADRIVMMRDGKICEIGNHDELLAKGGYYAEIFNEQKHLYEGMVI